uniref:Acyltransferase n=1 Tax=Globisporangium ultimum (strain ATCC 200006 / CBS 805.95 / DAOM BR144) TaxID=431595 RepID=K3WBZ2_GLOUD
MSARRNPQWPRADDLSELRSLSGHIWRRAVLGGIYFLWVCGLIGFGSMWGYTFFSLAKALVTQGEEPIPFSVEVYLSLMAAYEAYRWLIPVVPWAYLRHFVRNVFNYYPYFRFNTCVFEHELEAKEEPQAEPVTGDAAEGPKKAVNNDLAYNFTPVLKSHDKAMYAFHPHGILTCGMAINGAHHLRFAESDARWLVAENLFWFPALRDMLKWLEFDSVSKSSFVKLMEKGDNIGFVPGGFEEATLYQYGKHRVFIKKRFGFIKLALQYGYKVYPAYTFGEELTFTAFPFLLRWRLKLNEFKIPGAAFIGSPFCFFMPRSEVDLVTVVGHPIQFPHIEHPTKDDVQKYHALYVAKLQTLFDKHKGKYAADPSAELEIY